MERKEHQGGLVVEGEKEGVKTKVQALMKVVYDLCVKIKTLACLFIGGK
jgi:hypothetical protein